MPNSTEDSVAVPLLPSLCHATNSSSQVAIVGSNLCPVESLDFEIAENDFFKQDWRARSKTQIFQRALGSSPGTKLARTKIRLARDVFKVMDKDGDLKSYMESAGLAANDDEIKAMIRLGGGDSNGGVSFDGLLKIFGC